jgi:hypothetical protein
MNETWTHPHLGTFTYDSDEWVKLVDAPAFNAFTLDQHADGPPTGSFPLIFDCDGEEDLPTPADIELATAVLSNPSALVARIVNALWDDFNGRGPDSGMWWHGDLDQVTECMTEDRLPAPTRAPDLFPTMRFNRIAIRKQVDGHDKPLAELRFWAAFEEEHGVGILTDGHSVLGTGYSHGVTLFKPQ